MCCNDRVVYHFSAMHHLTGRLHKSSLSMVKDYNLDNRNQFVYDYMCY